MSVYPAQSAGYFYYPYFYFTLDDEVRAFSAALAWVQL